ncbi:MAG: hypothetical protein OEV42_20590, partial [Deltaproteobacteria bacterium]|nr:hypothetical protein [Deltaproteobacteria bacterium]
AGNLISQTDEEGKVTTFEYDKQNRRTKVIQPGGIETGYAYDKSGNVTSLTDPLGRITATAYDAWNRPWQVTDADGYVSTTWYDGEGKEVRIIDGNGYAKRFVRNELGLVEKAIDGELNSTLYTYDLNSNVTTVTDARGTVTATIYDAEDRPTKVVEAEGTALARSKTLLYDKMGNALEVTDYKGNVTKTTYNVLNLPATVTDAANKVTTTEYDRRGKVTRVTDRRNNSTAFEYDALGREVKVTDALGQFTQKTYDKVGNVKTATDKRGINTENTYDDLYRLTQTTRAVVRLVTNEYDNAGNVTATTDAENKRTGYTYSGRNLLIGTTYADGTTESRSYDGVGNVVTVTDEEGKVTTYTYDKENRETSVTFAGETTNKEYDAVGNLTLVTKPLGNTRSMIYDDLNRLLEVSEGALVTKYAYDKNSNVTFQMDALGRRVKYEYDALDRKVKHIQPGGIITSYVYDAEGNMTAMTDAKGLLFGYVYDKLNRQVEANYPDVATPYMTPLKTVTVHDANNNVLSVTETKRDQSGATVTGLTENTYDDFDRLTSSTQRGVAISYAYDNNGNRTSVTTPNGATTYAYDNRNRIATATADGLVTSYGYYLDGKKDTVAYPNGTDVKYTYHPTNRVKSIVNKVTVDSSVISSYAYDYDSNGNRTSQVEVQSGVSETTTYSYDDIDRMTEFTLTSGADVTVTSYTFEGYNRATEEVTVNGTVTSSKTYSYDALDRLVRVTDSVNGKTIGYGYDLNGNMLAKTNNLDSTENMQFEYDALNRLVKSTQVSVVKGLYDYNASGLRVRHRLSERGDVNYFYDGNAVIEERNATDSLLAHYRYADRLLSLNTGTVTQYYHHDALGNTVNLTDSAGAVKVSYSLDPWGTIRSQSGTSVNRQIFTGQEHDENTGLIYFGARYYDSETARFISQDTYLGEYGTPPSLHRYLYAYSNPTVYIDLYGYESIKVGENNDVYWAIEKDGWLWNSEVRRVKIGTKDGDNVKLTQEFGGGLVAHEYLKKEADAFWERASMDSLSGKTDISDYLEIYQNQKIRDYIEDRLNPHKEQRWRAAPEKSLTKKGLNLFVDIEGISEDFNAIRYGMPMNKRHGRSNPRFNAAMHLAYSGLESAGASKVFGGLFKGLKGFFSKKADDVVEEVVENTISSSIDGTPSAIYRGIANLSKHQKNILSQLGSPGERIIVKKRSITQKDLAAFTAATGDEFAMFTLSGQRMIIRGKPQGFQGIINEDWAKQMAAKGWRFSAHTHPIPQDVSPNQVLRASTGDKEIMQLFNNEQSAILNPLGGRSLFTEKGDSLSGWLP